MKNYDYVIVGGGMAAASAAKGIRQLDANGSIAMFSQEADPPYNRPPLSKALWKGKSVDTIWRKLEEVDLQLNQTASRIIPSKKQLECENGEAVGYRKLLLATGGKPRHLPFENNSIIYYRSLADYRRLRELTDAGSKFAVIGGGFIGSEIAAALSMNGKQVVLIFPGKILEERVFPAELADFVSNYYRKKGVDLRSGERVVSCETRNKQQVLKTDSGGEIIVDGVIAGIGIEPNVALAEDAGLETDNGILVDEFLRTNDPEIYAAGDVASFLCNGTRRRVEHEDNANAMGKRAGRNMAGENLAYDHLTSFYSDLFDLGYEAVGTLDSSLETFADWQKPNQKGVIYYLKDDRVYGVLLWNVWGKVKAARELITQPGPITPSSLRGKIS